MLVASGLNDFGPFLAAVLGQARVDAAVSDEVLRRLQVIQHRSKRAVVAGEFSAVRQKLALSMLTGQPSQRATLEELQVRSRAAELNFILEA